MALVGALGSSLWSADELMLWHDEAANLRWDESLAWHDAPDLVLGFAKHPLPSAAGAWGSARLSTRTASSGEALSAPGGSPVWQGATIDFAPRGGYVWGWGFALAEPIVRWRPGIAAGDIPNGDTRQLWSGSDPYPDQRELEFIPRSTVGVAALRHALSASTAPIHWGPGIFGGLVLGGNERGFPHAALTNTRPWHLLDAADEPLLVRYELLTGVLDGPRSGPEDPLLIGSRLGLRWWAFEAGLSTARQAGGDGHSVPGWAWSPIWAPPREEREQRADTVSSVDASADILGAVRLAGEYAVGHPLPDGTGDRLLGAYGVHAAAWMGILDWYDVTGDGRFRIAAEVRWCEAGVYGNPTYTEGWTYRDQPLAHPDGDDARSARLLMQSRLAESGVSSATLGWLQRGWRNQEDANPNPDQPDPAGLALPARAWTTWSLDLRWSSSVGEWDWWLDAGARAHRDQYFDDRGGELEGVIGAGAELRL